jgi:hypothetical protein
MEAQLVGDLKSANQAGRQTRLAFALRDLHNWLNGMSAAIEMIDK